MMLVYLPPFVYGAVKFLLVAVILVGMVFLLMGISHLSKVDEQPEADASVKLREELENNNRVITRSSVFSNFLARDSRRASK
ncbi:MAG: hypothetical protein K2M88_00755 [Muribaculaceae bacterium]|nr:hypothetical protein [Muribaculaceae bacterium]